MTTHFLCKSNSAVGSLKGAYSNKCAPFRVCLLLDFKVDTFFVYYINNYFFLLVGRFAGVLAGFSSTTGLLKPSSTVATVVSST